MPLFHLPVVHREIIWLVFFLLTVRLRKGFPVTQADFLKHRFLITLPYLYVFRSTCKTSVRDIVPVT